MKIALLGSASSSIGLAPFGNPDWEIWACSPGSYPMLARCDVFFELHRWEPGVVGKPQTQKPWFSPEYVSWMGQQKLVWMVAPVLEIPNSRELPFPELNKRWGSYFWTSSLAYMIAMALDKIIAERALRKASGMSDADWTKAAQEDCVGLWGVDMAATEEYGYQRAGCQHFLSEANRLGIGVVVPPESDLLRPMPPYGLIESTHFYIKATKRKEELEGRIAQSKAMVEQSKDAVQFLMGALDNHLYHMQTWGTDRDGMAASPEVANLQSHAIAQLTAPPPPPPPPPLTLRTTEASVAGAPDSRVVAIHPPGEIAKIVPEAADAGGAAKA